MEIYECMNFADCGNKIKYGEIGRKPIRCRRCQVEYSRKLRRDSYREKVKNDVKLAACQFKMPDGMVCSRTVPYVTNKPIYCPKHSRIHRVEWMKNYYTGEKIIECNKCKNSIKYRTRKPELCQKCRAKERLERRDRK